MAVFLDDGFKHATTDGVNLCEKNLAGSPAGLKRTAPINPRHDSILHTVVTCISLNEPRFFRCRSQLAGLSKLQNRLCSRREKAVSSDKEEPLELYACHETAAKAHLAILPNT